MSCQYNRVIYIFDLSIYAPSYPNPGVNIASTGYCGLKQQYRSVVDVVRPRLRGAEGCR